MMILSCLATLTSALMVCTSGELVGSLANSSSQHVQDREHSSEEMTGSLANSSSQHVQDREHRSEEMTGSLANSSSQHVQDREHSSEEMTGSLANSSSQHVQDREQSSEEMTGSLAKSSSQHVQDREHSRRNNETTTEDHRTTEPQSLALPTEEQRTAAPNSLAIMTAGATGLQRLGKSTHNPISENDPEMNSSAVMLSANRQNPISENDPEMNSSAVMLSANRQNPISENDPEMNSSAVVGSAKRSQKETVSSQAKQCVGSVSTNSDCVTEVSTDTHMQMTLHSSAPDHVEHSIVNNEAFLEQLTATSYGGPRYTSTKWALRKDKSETTSTAPAMPTSSVEDDHTRVLVTLGGRQFMVCERSMLCASRCLQTTSGRRWGNDITRNSHSVSQVDELQNAKAMYTSVWTPASGVNQQATGPARNARPSDLLDNTQHNGELQYDRGNLDFRLLNFNKSEKDAVNQANVRFKRKNEHSSVRCQESADAICFCDEVCVLYGDCCPDVFSSCFQLGTTNEILKFISSVWKRHFGCGPTERAKRRPRTAKAYLVAFVTEFASCHNTSDTTGMRLVSLCPPENKDISLRERCENTNGLQLPPVTVRFPYGDVTFKNVFCAQCHGVPDTDIKVWSVKYTCEKQVPANIIQSLTLADLTQLVTTGVCKPSFRWPVDMCKPRQCDSYSFFHQRHQWTIHMLSHLEQCSDSDETLCRSYYYPSLDFDKNVHCKACLGTSRRRREGSTHAACNMLLHNRLVSIQRSPTGGILIILDLTGTYSHEPGKAGFYICQDHEVFDPNTLTCRTLNCHLGSRPYRGVCVDFTNTSFVDGSSQIHPDGWSVVLVTFTSLNNSEDLCVVSAALNNTRFTQNKCSENASCSMDVIHRECVSTSSCRTCEKLMEHKDELRQMVTTMLITIFNSSLEFTHQVPALTSELHRLGLFNDTHLSQVANTNSSTVTSYRCSSNNILHQVWNFSLVEKNSTVYVLVKTSHQEIYYPLRNVGFQVTLSHDPDRSVTWVLTQSVYVCDPWLSPRDNCTVVKYKLNDTLQNGSRLMILSSGVYYDNGDFELSGDEVFVCTNFSFPYEPNNFGTHQSLAYLVLSWLLTIISIIFLFLMLVLYCLLPELCTLPGRMTASLAAAMMLTFLSNLFTLVELHHDYICPLAAALSHVVTLAHFGWMSAIAVNMALTFGPLRNSLVRTVSDRTLFFRYNLVVWGSSIVLVMTSVILDLTHREANTTSETATVKFGESKYPRYGYPYCTWFSGPMWTQLVFVMIPYLITFVVSLVGFLVALTGLQQASKSSKKLGKKSSDKTRCMIYLKLATAMGFSWVTSAVSNIYPNSVVLPYVCLCLVLLQGVLLFLAFMVNHRVYLLLVGMVRSNIVKHSLKDATNSTVITTRYI